MRPPQGDHPSPFVVRKRIAIAQRLRCSFAFRQWLAQTPAPPSQGARWAFRFAPRPPCPLLPCAPQRGAPCNDVEQKKSFQKTRLAAVFFRKQFFFARVLLPKPTAPLNSQPNKLPPYLFLIKASPVLASIRIVYLY